MPKKIKRTVPHYHCHHEPVSTVLIGTEVQPLAIDNKPRAIWGILSQCSVCGKIRVSRIEKEEDIPKEQKKENSQKEEDNVQGESESPPIL